MSQYPLISFVMLTFNQERYIKAALEGAVGQDYPNLEIIVSDDCSQDGTAGIIESFLASYKGPHAIVYNQNERNLGLIPHLNKILSMTHGEYIVLAAGDDISLPNRTMLSFQKIKASDTCSLALNFSYIDAEGNKLGRYGFELTDELSSFRLCDYINGDHPRPSGPSRIISRKLLDVFGLFNEDCPTEDTTITLRALLLGGVAYYGEVGVLYRWHGENLSSEKNLYARIDPQKIYNQYFDDLCLAKKAQLIDNEEFDAVKKRIDDYKATQIECRMDYYNPHKQIVHSKNNRRFTRHSYYLKLLLNKYVLRRRISVIKPWISISWGRVEHNNWGDDINLFFLKHISKDCLLPVMALAFPASEMNFYGLEDYPVISAIGSVFHLIDDPNTIVWGSGLLNEKMLPLVVPKQILAVRGPLTRQVLLDNGLDCPEVYGDPALLLPFFYKPKHIRKKYKLGIVPHYVDCQKEELRKFEDDPEVLIIKMSGYRRWTDVIDQINRCEFVASSSLHGLIVAESYGVPNLWVEIREPLVGDLSRRFKFHDFFQSMGLDRNEPFTVTCAVTKEDLLAQKANYVKSPGISLKPLVKACPMRLNVNEDEIC